MGNRRLFVGLLDRLEGLLVTFFLLGLPVLAISTLVVQALGLPTDFIAGAFSAWAIATLIALMRS